MLITLLGVTACRTVSPIERGSLDLPPTMGGPAAELHRQVKRAKDDPTLSQDETFMDNVRGLQEKVWGGER
jgi:hypothetical protein